MTRPGSHHEHPAEPAAESVDQAREALRAHAERYADLGLDQDAEALAAGGDFPPAPSGMPLIVDTDIGGDPDDAIALVVAAGLPELSLVLTSDEHHGRRARFARHLLDQLDRSDVPVVAGFDLGNQKYWSAEGLTPDSVPHQPTDVAAAVADLCDRRPGQIRWLGIGPWSNLADVLHTHTGLAPRLQVTLMGGALNYRHPNRAEHNIRLGIDAARIVLGAGVRPWVVPSDVTFRPENEITPNSAEYEMLAHADAPDWARTLTSHMNHWFDSFYPGTMQHDAHALALALRLPFLDVDLTRVALDGIGRMTENHDSGEPVFLTRNADRQAFRTWLRSRLGSALHETQAPV